jgi:hypothetical protein
VVEKHDFCGIQRKIPQKSDFAQKQDLNPELHIEAAVDIAKMFEQKLQQKSDFSEKQFLQTSTNTRFLLFVCIPQKLCFLTIFGKKWRFLRLGVHFWRKSDVCGLHITAKSSYPKIAKICRLQKSAKIGCLRIITAKSSYPIFCKNQVFADYNSENRVFLSRN